MDPVTLSDLIGKRVTATKQVSHLRNLIVVQSTGVVRALAYDAANARFAILLQIERTRVEGSDVARRHGVGRRLGPLSLVTVNTQDHEIIVGAPEEA